MSTENNDTPNRAPRPLRDRALDLLQRHRDREAADRKQRQEDEEKKLREGAEREAHKAVETVFAKIDERLIPLAGYSVEESRNVNGILSITYTITVEGMRFGVTYGNGDGAGIGLRLLGTCPECGRDLSPRVTIRDAIALAVAIEELDEELSKCQHLPGQPVSIEFEVEDASDAPPTPAGWDDLRQLAIEAHQAELALRDTRAETYANQRVNKLCGLLVSYLHLAEQPRPFTEPFGPLEIDGKKLAGARYGDLVFVQLLQPPGASDISIMVDCAKCGRPTVADFNITSRAKLGEALADGSVTPWRFHRHPDDEEAADPAVKLFEELRSLLKRVLDLSEE